jgi:hypothetical protein
MYVFMDVFKVFFVFTKPVWLSITELGLDSGANCHILAQCLISQISMGFL